MVETVMVEVAPGVILALVDVESNEPPPAETTVVEMALAKVVPGVIPALVDAEFNVLLEERQNGPGHKPSSIPSDK